MTKLVGSLAKKHQGKSICVCGGAPSLPDDLKKVNADIYISVNQHGLLLRPCDYIVAIDSYHLTHGYHMGDYLKQYNTPIISPKFYADYRIANFYVEGFMGNSGLLAISMATLMGASVVYVAGIEMYTGKSYFHDEDAPSPGFDLGAVKHQHRIDVMLNFNRNQNMRKLSGPLPILEFKEGETFHQASYPKWAHKQAGMTTKVYRCIAGMKWHGEYLVEGEHYNLTEVEYENLGGFKRFTRNL